MARKTIYCAQAFWRREGRLEGGQPHQFLDADRAREGAAALITGGCAGVAVFSVTGEPAIDLWGEPQLIEALGDVPAIVDSEWPEVA